MRHRLLMRQWIPYEISAVFDFFADPGNLPPLMPGWQAARIDSSTLVAPPPAPDGRRAARAAGEGSRMRISFRPAPFSPIRMRWDARITEFAWDEHFCDVQDRGPFAYWRHCHRVRTETRDGVQGTALTDDLHYAFPLEGLGDIANDLGGEWQLRALFRYRQRQLSKVLPAWLNGAVGD